MTDLDIKWMFENILNLIEEQRWPTGSIPVQFANDSKFIRMKEFLKTIKDGE